MACIDVDGDEQMSNCKNFKSVRSFFLLTSPDPKQRGLQIFPREAR